MIDLIKVSKMSEMADRRLGMRDVVIALGQG